MDFKQLRYFIQIVESGSMAKASRQLFIAQPALSQQLAKLEGEVGMQLLTRSSRGVTPTDSGMALYHHARFLVRQMDQAVSIARRETTDVHGIVSLGLPATTVLAIGVPLMELVRDRYPNIMLNVVEGMSGHLAQMLRAGQLEMAILFSPDAASDLPSTPLLEEELFVLLPRSSTLIPPESDSLTLDEVAALPLILPTGTHGLRRRISTEFERRNLLPKVVAEIDSLSLLMSCVQRGMGATIKPMSALQLERYADQQWRALAISDARLRRRNYLFTAPPHMLSPAAACVAATLQETTSQLARDGAWPGVSLIEQSVGSGTIA